MFKRSDKSLDLVAVVAAFATVGLLSVVFIPRADAAGVTPGTLDQASSKIVGVTKSCTTTRALLGCPAGTRTQVVSVEGAVGVYLGGSNVTSALGAKFCDPATCAAGSISSWGVSEVGLYCVTASGSVTVTAQCLQ